MKFICATILFFGLPILGFSQITWDQITADTARGYETESTIETKNKVTFANAGTYRWVRSFDQICKIQNAFCDKVTCYLETTDSAQFTVTAGESFDMICYFYPYDSCCPKDASISLLVYNVNDPSENSTAFYHLDLWCASSSVGEIATSPIKILPNPASNYFEVKSDQKFEMTVTNLLGETINVNRGDRNNTFDISNLIQGVYYVTVQTESRLITQKLIKN